MDYCLLRVDVDSIDFITSTTFVRPISMPESLTLVSHRTEDVARKLLITGGPEDDEGTMSPVCPNITSLDRERSQDTHTAELTPKSICSKIARETRPALSCPNDV